MPRLIDRLRPQTAEARQGLVELLETGFGDLAGSSLTDFRTYVTEGYRANGVVFAVLLARVAMVQEAVFATVNMDGEESRTHPALTVLKRPWPGATTRDLLARIETNASLAGNAYVYKVNPLRLMMLRPDWTGILSDGQGGKTGYLYTPGGSPHGVNDVILPEDKPVNSRAQGVTWLLTTDQVAHYAGLTPDPLAEFRGMSWLRPIAREIDSDSGMTNHKQKFLDNAATPNLLIKVQKALSKDGRKVFKDELNARHEGVPNAYRTLLLDQGADATVIGANLRQMTFTAVQGAGETRIAAAAGVPPVIVGLSEGLQAATYSNYQLAMRRFADLTSRPIWGGITGALASIIPLPDELELTYQDSQIPALQQDALDDAKIVNQKALTMATLVRAGYNPDEIPAAVEASDLTSLTHTGKIPTTVYQDDEDTSGND